MNRTLYSLLFYLIFPFALLRLYWRARKAPAYGHRISERLARRPVLQNNGILVHAVSVGEVIAAAPLVEVLLQRHPDLPIILSCMTPTGSERIQALFGQRVQHLYLPYDLPCLMNRFLNRLHPRLVIIVETELWPNLIHQCALRRIPTALINARLSERSARGYARFPRLTGPMLREMSWLAIQTQAEADRFLQLGASPEQMQVTGSIKFDLKPDPKLQDRAVAQRRNWRALERSLWIAASTHAREDEIVLDAHRTLLTRYPDLLLILAPRHPERFKTVYDLCNQQGFATCLRSSTETVNTSTQILLGDTMGELLYLYALADIAFVGGSLVAHGGHNLLEPATLGKPLLSGPHLFNFQEISQQLLQADALRLVEDAPSLATAVQELLSQPQQASHMAKAALAVVQANQGALERVLTGLQKLLDA